jgi:hypothetical protein
VSKASAVAAGREPSLPSVPTPTWQAFSLVIDQFRATGIPAVIKADALAVSPEGGGWQVRAALGVLGLIDRAGTPQFTLKRLVNGHDEVLGEALRRLYPDLVAAIDRGAPQAEVAAHLNIISAGETTRTRFRSFLLSALENEGVEVGRYRRLGSTSSLALPSPAGPRLVEDPQTPEASSVAGNANDLAPNGGFLQPQSFSEQMAAQHALSLIASQERAWDRGDVAIARAIGEELHRLRQSLGPNQGDDDPT